MKFSQANFPPDFDCGMFLRAPRRMREDMLQEAWVGFLCGQDPSVRARNFLRKELLYEQRMIPMSALPHDEQDDCEEDRG